MIETETSWIIHWYINYNVYTCEIILISCQNWIWSCLFFFSEITDNQQWYRLIVNNNNDVKNLKHGILISDIQINVIKICRLLLFCIELLFLCPDRPIERKCVPSRLLLQLKLMLWMINCNYLLIAYRYNLFCIYNEKKNTLQGFVRVRFLRAFVVSFCCIFFFFATR